jgi:DNA-binding transcriptional LysR family regulator
MAAVLVTRATRKIAQLAPTIGIDILSLDSPEEGIERGEIDFLVMPEQFLATAHPSKELFRDSYVCIAWSENTSIGEELTLDQYFAASHIGIRFDTQPVDSLEEWIFQHTGQLRQIAVKTGDYTLIPQFVVGTQRIATVHHLLARMYARYLPIRILKVPLEMPELIEKIQWHRFREQDPGIAWMRQLLRTTAREISEASASVSQPATDSQQPLEAMA